MSYRRGKWATQKFRSVVGVIHAGSGFQSSYANAILPRNGPILAASKFGSGYWMHHPILGLQLFTFGTNSNTRTDSNEVKNVKVQVQPTASLSGSFTFPKWLRWVLGSVLSLLLPFWKHNREKRLRIEGEAEVVVEEVEKVANVVEKVATVAEKVSEEIAEKLPEDSNLKKAALVVESVSKQVAHDAQLAQEFLHKVDELKNDLDDLESFVEPVIDKIGKKESERK